MRRRGECVKSDIRTWLAGADFRKIVEAAGNSNRTIRTLITLTYSNDLLTCWRSIDAIGRCAVGLAAARSGVYRNYLRRLFWMMSDESGSVSPCAPEVIGEIIRANPTEFADFIPLAVSLLDLEPEDRPLFLPGILYALGRMAESSPEMIEDRLGDIETCLRDADPQVRVGAILCLDRIRAHSRLLRHPELEVDSAPVAVYSAEQLRNTSVGRIYSETLLRIRAK